MATGATNTTISETQKGGNYGGVSLDFNLTHGTANTAFVNGDMTPRGGSLMLDIGGVISNLSIADWCATLGYKTSLFQVVRSWTSVADQLVAPAVGVKEVRRLSIRLAFARPVNLKEKQQIKASLAGNGLWGANVDASASTVEVTFFEGFGIGWGYPQYNKTAVEVNANSANLSIAKDTTRIWIVNHSLSDMLSTTAPFTGASISSDKGGQSYTISQLVGKRTKMFEIASTASIRYHNFELTPESGIDFDAGQITVNCTGANITADNNAIITESTVVTDGSALRYIERVAKHENANISKLPTNVRSVMFAKAQASR